MRAVFLWKIITVVLIASIGMCLSTPALAADKPNILLIMSDDVGITNISAYGEGLVGYKTPNIDRIANESMRFTDYYVEQSCTAGRSAFVTGQLPVRTGLTKVGLPGGTWPAERRPNPGGAIEEPRLHDRAVR